MNVYKTSFKETLRNKWKKKEKIAFGLSLAAILVLSAVVVGLAQHNLYLSERLAVSDGEDYNEGVQIDGYFYISVMREGESEFTLYHYGHNVMTNVGKNATRHMIADSTWVSNNATTEGFRWIAIGTGNGGGAASTNLTTMFDRQSGTFSITGAAYNYSLTYTWTAGAFGGETIQEAGTFNHDDATGILLNYQDFTGITLQSGDSLQVTFEFQIS